jgi:phenylacetate-CoA ligase
MPIESEYWNPKNETMPREDLARLQLAKLKLRVELAYARSRFHRRKYEAAGFHPDQLKTLADLERIPFTTREEWMASIAEHPLYGDLLAVPPERAIRYHLTSGTSGRTPLRVLDGMKDWQWIAECWCYGFWAFGVRPADTVFFAFSYGSFIGFWGAHYACEKLGALVIPSGNMTTENRVKQIVEMGATVLCSTPTYALRLSETARGLGIDLKREARVKRIILSGEPAGSIPASRRLIEDAWGAACGDTAGMTELGTIVIFECSHQPGGTHILEDHYIEEVIDPESGRAVGYGEKGERVVTSFGRGFIPVLRYRTADMVERVPAATCGCGRTFDIYRGGIQGRFDDMRKIRGTNVYPRAIEAIVREYPPIDEFQIVFHRVATIDEVTVRVELKPGLDGNWAGLSAALAADLVAAHEGLRINIERAAAGELPRFELKAKRFIDKRGQP